jgi:formamidopyrimidine-DNA glycosylase
MPELPEVETVCRALAPFMCGKQIERAEFLSPKIRNPLKPSWKKQVSGETVSAVTRRAKYIVIETDMRAILLHLGMTGVVRCVAQMKKDIPQKHDHVRIIFSDGSGIVFNDARRFGQFEVMARSQVFAHKSLINLGYEPFDPALTAASFHEIVTRSQRAIKLVIMDQFVIVGVGNIYASEALYKAGIHPARAAATLTHAESKKLLTAIRSVLKTAITKGGSTLRDFRHADGALGYFQHEFQVYDREGLGCGRCDCKKSQTLRVQKMTQGGRTTYFCPHKQK